MIERGYGVMLFAGATAGVKGGPRSVALAGTFAMRWLARAPARDLGPRGIHVASVNIDGGIDIPWYPSVFRSLRTTTCSSLNCRDLLASRASGPQCPDDGTKVASVQGEILNQRGLATTVQSSRLASTAAIRRQCRFLESALCHRDFHRCLRGNLALPILKRPRQLKAYCFSDHALIKGLLTLSITERHIEGSSRTTIQNYCSRGRSDLVRGRDFIIRRYAVGRSRAMITDAA